MIDVKHGHSRVVVLVGRLAIKLARMSKWKLFLMGMLSNVAEAELYRQQTKPCAVLCPVLWSGFGGIVLVARRANALSEDVWRTWSAESLLRLMSSTRPSARPEIKQDSYGILNGRVVAVDYAPLYG